jgi:hypothetical protein
MGCIWHRGKCGARNCRRRREIGRSLPEAAKRKLSLVVKAETVPVAFELKDLRLSRSCALEPIP